MPNDCKPIKIDNPPLVGCYLFAFFFSDLLEINGTERKMRKELGITNVLLV